MPVAMETTSHCFTLILLRLCYVNMRLILHSVIVLIYQTHPELFTEAKRLIHKAFFHVEKMLGWIVSEMQKVSVCACASLYSRGLWCVSFLTKTIRRDKNSQDEVSQGIILDLPNRIMQELELKKKKSSNIRAAVHSIIPAGFVS